MNDLRLLTFPAKPRRPTRERRSTSRLPVDFLRKIDWLADCPVALGFLERVVDSLYKCAQRDGMVPNR